MQREMLSDSFVSAYQSIISHVVHIIAQSRYIFGVVVLFKRFRLVIISNVILMIALNYVHVKNYTFQPIIMNRNSLGFFQFKKNRNMYCNDKDQISLAEKLSIHEKIHVSLQFSK